MKNAIGRKKKREKPEKQTHVRLVNNKKNYLKLT